jgi:hypothetical protein
VKFIFLSFLITSSNAFSNYTFTIKGEKQTEKFVLNSEVKETLTRQETQVRTCYNTYISGYKDNCAYYPEVQCQGTNDFDRVCNQVQVYRCTKVPEYVRVPYYCNQVVEVPYNVVHTVQANFLLLGPDQMMSYENDNCLINYRLNADTIEVFTDSCYKYLIFLQKFKKETIESDGSIAIDFWGKFSLLDMKTFLAPIAGGVKNLQLNGHILSFVTGDLIKNSNFEMSLTIQRKRKFLSDLEIADRGLKPTDYSFEKINDNSGLVKIDLSKVVNNFDETKKHTISIDLNANYSSDNGHVINLLNLPHTGSTITVN